MDTDTWATERIEFLLTEMERLWEEQEGQIRSLVLDMSSLRCPLSIQAELSLGHLNIIVVN